MSLFFLGAARALTAVRPSGVARGLVVLGVVVTLAGIVQTAGGDPRVYGVWHPRKSWVPAAPFINANHLAGSLLMAVSVALGHLGGSVARALRGAPPGWRNRAVWLGSREASEIGLAGFAVLVDDARDSRHRVGLGPRLPAAAFALFGGWAWRRQPGWRRRVLLPAGLAAALAVAAARVGLDVVGAEVETSVAAAFDSGGWVEL